MKPLLHLFFLFLLFAGCHPIDKQEYAIYGQAQGTTYNIQYWGDSLLNYQTSIDSLLRELDSSLSTYLSVSIISQVNEQQRTAVDLFFKEVLARSIKINAITGGAFDPSIMPLVKAWGFGPNDAPQIDTTLIDSLKALIGLSNFELSHSSLKEIENIKSDTCYLIKNRPHSQVDFNGIAQGYSVDILANFLEDHGVKSYLIELGGEIKAKGENSNGKWWKIGIDKPEEHVRKRSLQATLPLKNLALATSGNYRNFYELNGVKYAHTIDPASGYPVTHSLLSVSVLAEECMDADAYATAFMVMGFIESKHFIEENPDLGLEAYFIYTDEGGEQATYSTLGLANLLEEDL